MWMRNFYRLVVIYLLRLVYCYYLSPFIKEYTFVQSSRESVNLLWLQNPLNDVHEIHGDDVTKSPSLSYRFCVLITSRCSGYKLGIFSVVSLLFCRLRGRLRFPWTYSLWVDKVWHVSFFNQEKSLIKIKSNNTNTLHFRHHLLHISAPRYYP